jgi:ketosteroid isomerase-like protein
MSDDHLAIADLVYDYAERIDAGDFAGVADLLAHAELAGDGMAPIRGRDEILEMYERTARRYPDDGTPKTKHVTTNVRVQVDPAADRASARSYFTVLQAVPGELALQPVIAGRYRDDFERVDGTWRFARRHFVADLVGDLSKHMLWAL